MVEKFWNTYVNMRFKCYYYEHCMAKNVQYDRVFTAIPLIITSGGLAFFLSTSNLSVLSAFVIFIGQALSVVSHLMPYSKRAMVLSGVIPDIEKLLVKIDCDWSAVNSDEFSYSFEEINDLTMRYEKECLAIEQKALSGVSIPRDKKCEKKAMEETELFLKIRHNAILEKAS